MELKAEVLVMTMPSLETYFIKRSRVYPVHYVYVFHSIVSSHTIYRKGAFDHFDSIFCAGPHHIKEIKATEQLYNLNHKNLVMYGYGLLDKLQKNKPVQNQEICTKDGRKKILVAPSWGKKGLLETKGLDLVKILLDAGYYVTVRPHPMSIKKSSKIIKKIREKFEGNSDFILDTNTSSFEQLFSSYALITDWSGIGFEYAFVCERPVIYVDVPKKAHNKEYDKIQFVPLEVGIRDKIGEIISINNLESMPERIEFLYGHVNEFQNKIKKIRDGTVFNIGESGQAAADEIIQIINEMAPTK
jgi:YidC/Oxa1 family membrane protein insertase